MSEKIVRCSMGRAKTCTGIRKRATRRNDHVCH
jgi:hypothetical protein